MMRRLPKLILLLILILGGGLVSAQDIPVYSQKLTNSFLYNPSVAGNTLGSATLSYRQQWAGATGSPQTFFASVHTPFARHRLGTGLNFYQETAGVNQTMYASGAIAYHVRFTDTNLFSMGVSAEYVNSRINYSRVDALDPNDVLLTEDANASSKVDFNFGLSYKTRYVSFGGSANRISNIVGLTDSSRQFPAFYTGFLNFSLPLAGERDLLEPVVYYRNLSNGENQIDAGLFYTFNEKITIGGSYRTGGAAALTAGFRVGKNMFVGYSREMLTGELGSAVRSSNEFTLRLDFRDHNYYSNSRNARQINTSALALRRKTLAKYPASRSPYTFANHNKKFARKNYVKSPNYRMESSKKLMTKRVNRKPAYKKRKPPRRRR
ncbi:MAG TPA: type IX secretion system membrane protein PorP/SprF [Ohtaekwangia sp.]|nr:type IX secretion system membrane protein PorP/SprF [Ohtaekwangia sp.]